MSTEQHTQKTTMDNGVNQQQAAPQCSSTPPLDNTSNDQEDSSRSCAWKFVHKHHSFCFVTLLFFITAMMGIFLWCSNSNLKASQNKIIEAFKLTQEQTESNIQAYIKQSTAHRNALQSCVDKQIKLLTSICNDNGNDSVLLTTTALFVKLEADIKTLEEQNNTIIRMSTDSLTRKYESTMSNVISERMLELHLAKIEHEYTNITIWAAVLTIVFLIFSFFSLFKIEQSRKEIEDARDEINKVKSKAQTDLESTIDNASYIKSDIQTQHESEINTYKSGLKSLLEEYTRLLEGIKNKEANNNE